ncbi:glutathione hydrolase 5 proenzyme-like [Colossoma macropomum]|uniref:glutathione hydrolase 5 proenzyme-like n=1 Tax=Colossoma macropomum TaxID=42526 RepID=UPI001864C169|nr:glutathione hydrolase 5 proenzyme-like [Colossoma macropomum]
MLMEGDTVKYEKLADTLEKIAERGAEEFYTGETARDLISDIQEAGGTLTLEDLRSVEVTESEAWNVSLGNYTMYFPPPPSGGALVSFILNVMEGYKPTPASLERKERVLTYHRYIEACKFAKGLRKFMRDPRFNDITDAYKIIQKEFADDIRKKITDDRTHDPEYYSVTPPVDTLGTTHISVLDKDGMAVSVTSSINFIFGSGVYSAKTGIILNNMLTDFCKQIDKVQAGERPPSSTATMIIRSKVTNHTVVIGGSGGTMITTGMSMALMNFLWFGKNLNDSISAPVVTAIDKKDLNFECEFDKEVRVALRVLGHKIPIYQNAVNALSKKNGECIEAVSDSRKKAIAAGY